MEKIEYHSFNITNSLSQLNLGTSKLISVVIPIHNCYIYDLLLSLRESNLENVEIIFIIKSSKNETYDKVCKILSNEKFDYQILKTSKYSTLSVVKNLGINMSNGEYIYFLGSDEWFHNKSIDLLKKLILENPHIDIFTFKVQSRNTFGLHDLKHSSTNYIGSCISYLFDPFLSSNLKVYKKISFSNFSFNENIECEDMYLAGYITTFKKIKIFHSDTAICNRIYKSTSIVKTYLAENIIADFIVTINYQKPYLTKELFRFIVQKHITWVCNYYRSEFIKYIDFFKQFLIDNDIIERSLLLDIFLDNTLNPIFKAEYCDFLSQNLDILYFCQVNKINNRENFDYLSPTAISLDTKFYSSEVYFFQNHFNFIEKNNSKLSRISLDGISIQTNFKFINIYVVENYENTELRLNNIFITKQTENSFTFTNIPLSNGENKITLTNKCRFILSFSNNATLSKQQIDYNEKQGIVIENNISYSYEDRNSENLIITFPAFIGGNNNEIQYPITKLKSTKGSEKYDILAFQDSSLLYGTALLYDMYGNNCSENVLNIVKNIFKNKKYNSITIFGSSKGGYSAIYYSHLLRNDNIFANISIQTIAIAPVINFTKFISKYYASRILFSVKDEYKFTFPTISEEMMDKNGKYIYCNSDYPEDIEIFQKQTFNAIASELQHSQAINYFYPNALDLKN